VGSLIGNDHVKSRGTLVPWSGSVRCKHYHPITALGRFKGCKVGRFHRTDWSEMLQLEAHWMTPYCANTRPIGGLTATRTRGSETFTSPARTGIHAGTVASRHCGVLLSSPDTPAPGWTSTEGLQVAGRAFACAKGLQRQMTYCPSSSTPGHSSMQMTTLSNPSWQGKGRLCPPCRLAASEYVLTSRWGPWCNDIHALESLQQ
jgi:hypothetical protein